MQERNFWLYNMIGSIIWAASINMLWVFFIDNYKSILENLWTVMTVLLVATIWYFYFFKKEFLMSYMRDKQMEIETRIERDRVKSANKGK